MFSCMAIMIKCAMQMVLEGFAMNFLSQHTEMLRYLLISFQESEIA